MYHVYYIYNIDTHTHTGDAQEKLEHLALSHYDQALR
jgi:hypothetical protein